MKILHTGDWHLGRIFHGVHLTEDQAILLSQLEELAKSFKPDVYIIAGDVYDRAIPPVEAVELLNDHLSVIRNELKIPVIIVSGNHDNPVRLEFGKKMFAQQGLHIRGSISCNIEPVTISDDWGDVYFYPVPYVDKDTFRNIFNDKDIKNQQDGLCRIIENINKSHPESSRKVMIGHVFTQGGVGSDSERPLSVGGADVIDPAILKGFNYTALGHLHRPQKVQDQSIRYAGSLMKYSISEIEHRKSICCIEMDENGACSIEEVSLNPRRDLKRIEGLFSDLLEQSECEDYMTVCLLDRGPVYNSMNRLRKVFPNIIHIERKELISDSITKKSIDHRKVGDLELFKIFYQDITGEAATEDEQQVFIDAVELMTCEESKQ